jgi:DNA-binding transcriptional ArsR family regulator
MALPVRRGPITAAELRAVALDIRVFIPRFRNSGNVIRKPGAENSYRQSRLCRLLGNPVAFAIVQALADHKELSPSELAQAVGRSVQRVSTVLGALRLADVVRYDTDGKRNRYRLKHPVEVRSVIAALSRFVKVAADPGL